MMDGIDRIVEKCAKKQPVWGTHAKFTDSSLVEILAISGFDYIWIDGEHGAMSIETINNHIRAAQAKGAAAFLRVPWNDPVLVKPYLEMGVDGIIFPFVITAEEAMKAVASCTYPLQGVRGFGPGRCNDYGLMDQNVYLEKAKSIWKIIQIEHIDAVKNIDGILAVEGIDAIVVGMSDLSSSMGILNQLHNPELKALLDDVAKKILESGIPFGIAMSSFDEEIVSDWKRRGVSLITIGGDQDFVREGAIDTLGKLNKLYK
jgi:2-dehydro-3-deoxyglucarate aldolase/4-hydroxy-2-oxoheptanedioate aldolase